MAEPKGTQDRRCIGRDYPTRVIDAEHGKPMSRFREVAGVPVRDADGQQAEMLERGKAALLWSG